MHGLQNEHWYRIADTRPYIRTSTEMARHKYRGVTWYVLRNPVNAEVVRINEIGYEFVQRLDGQSTVDEIFSEVSAKLASHTPGQEEIITMLARLMDANLIQTDQPMDVRRLVRQRDQKRRRSLASELNPLAFKIAVMNPTRILQAIERPTRALFTGPATVIWLLLMLASLIAAISFSREISHAIASVGWDNQFVFWFWIAYPALKLVHELAHGVAVRHYGGDVNELGVRLLVLMPVPYVDASASSLLADKYSRAIVAASGILAEITIAALALFFWLLIEPGATRDFLLAIMLTGSVSTLLFNGNPLMKFDGYFVLSDLFELPNLATRSARYFVYRVKRNLLGLQDIPDFVVAPRETRWLVGYALASWTYKLVVFSIIALLLASWHWAAGSVVALIAGYSYLLRPGARAIAFLWTSPSLNGRRSGVLVLTAIGLVLLTGALTLVPFPNATLAQGVVWLPEKARVRSEIDGFVNEILVNNGQRVRTGQPVITLKNQELLLQVQQLRLQIDALSTEHTSQLASNAQGSEILAERIAQKQAELTRALDKRRALSLTARSDGRIAIPKHADLLGTWIQAGELTSFVLGSADTTIRVALANARITKVREATNRVWVKLVDKPSQQFEAQLIGDSPAGTTQLPSAALGSAAGGLIRVDPQDPSKSAEQVFVVDVRIDGLQSNRAGQSALVRFEHPPTPIAIQVGVALRRLLLSHVRS